MNKFKFGRNLRIVRVSKGISEETMAIGLSMSQSKYADLERSTTTPNPEIIEKLCELLAVEPPTLLLRRTLDEPMPESGSEQRAKKILYTPIGVIIFWILVIPIIRLAFKLVDYLSVGLGATEQTSKSLQMTAGLLLMFLAFQLMRRIQRGKR